MKAKSFKWTPLEFTRDGKWATLTKSEQLTVETDQGHLVVFVEPGFRWNGNSGCFPCRFSDTNEGYNAAIMLHDVLYHRVGLSKADADDLLRGCLREVGYGRVMAGLIHRAVTLFGRKAFYDDSQTTLDNLDYITVTMNGVIIS